jgi:hypothetical protein
MARITSLDLVGSFSSEAACICSQGHDQVGYGRELSTAATNLAKVWLTHSSSASGGTP